MPPLTILSGSANAALALAVAHELGIPLAACLMEHYPDGEQHLEIRESVRGHDVFLIQPTSPPVADHLLELLLLADASRRAGAGSVTAVVPYFGYARHDRRASGREPVAARVIADLMASSGIGRVVAVDLHTPAIEGFFAIPIEHLTAVPLLAAAAGSVPDDLVVIAPDVGAVRLAEEYARRLDRPMAALQKVRTGPAAVRVREVVGDVRGRPLLVVDDMISTGHTIAAAVRALLAAGARADVTVAVSHGLFVGGADGVLGEVPIGRFITTDSIPSRADLPLPVEAVSLAGLLANVIRRLRGQESLSDVIAHR